MAKFDNVEIGTELYSIGGGYCKVVGFHGKWIRVEFEDGYWGEFDRDGVRFLDIYPTLFWNKVKVVEE